MVSACRHGIRCFRPAWLGPCPRRRREKADFHTINTATAEQLTARPGISGAYTEEIIKGRPSQRKDTLVQKKILPRAAYEGITYELVAMQK